MKMLEMDAEDLQELSKISKEEALEFVAEGLPIICQTNRRDFYQVDKISDLNQTIHLESLGVYEQLKFYID